MQKGLYRLESINPESLKGASKGQNRITEYRKMLQRGSARKVLTYAGYILDFHRTRRIASNGTSDNQRELPIDIMESSS